MTTALDMIRIAEEAQTLVNDTRDTLGLDEAGLGFASLLATEGLMIEYTSQLRGGRTGAPHRYKSYQHLALLSGEYVRQKIHPLPDDVDPMPARECFRNALMLAQSDEDRFVYYEGYATTTATHLPVLHAWCWDSVESRVVDPTWASIDYPEDDIEAMYIGIPMDIGFVMRRTLHTSHWGILGNDWMPSEDGLPFMALSCGFRFSNDYVAVDYDVEEAA